MFWKHLAAYHSISEHMLPRAYCFAKTPGTHKALLTKKRLHHVNLHVSEQTGGWSFEQIYNNMVKRLRVQ